MRKAYHTLPMGVSDRKSNKETKSSMQMRKRRVRVLLADDLLMNAQTLTKVGKRAKSRSALA